jgi:hypothetical protein
MHTHTHAHAHALTKYKLSPWKCTYICQKADNTELFTVIQIVIHKEK